MELSIFVKFSNQVILKNTKNLSKNIRLYNIFNCKGCFILTQKCKICLLKKIKIVLPICLAKIIAPFFEAYYNLKKQTPLFTKYSLYTLSSNSNFSNKKAKEELGYKNRDMKDTIKDTIRWLYKKGEKWKRKIINITSWTFFFISFIV